MSSVGKVTEEIINRSPFLREAMTENLINVSALSRKIKPELEDILGKSVKEGAIVMAIKRMTPGHYYHVDVKIRNFIATLGDFLVRSDLEDFTYQNSNTLNLKQSELMRLLVNKRDYFYTFCHGVGESTIITSNSISKDLTTIFKGEKLKSNTKNLASITIKLPPQNTEISGIYYYILKHLAWEGINIVEVVSTANEFTVVVNDDDIDSAFSVLMNLKKSSK
ncbi:aspartate kinase [Brumimicrobium salinarum]|uniref:Aspartate kinase n=1 Tax=Brumimicrobium salinarum TaxID=2058658 RepID=A0A2I0R1I3_9FLAO|nr:hypothetical protein [Brumimicrobium salinarum]PKR80270.1 aspartate kinase [Brumimicrobium salinarum]